MNIGEYIKNLRLSKGLSQEELGKIIGVQRAAVQKWECGRVQNLKRETIKKLSEIFEVSPSSFIQEEDINEKINSCFNVMDNSCIRNLPLYESVSAGFGAYASNCIIGYVPVYIKSDYEAENSLCIKVVGDSMYPKIEDGDIIQVEKQDSVNSGTVAVVLVDDEEGFVKKVIYGKDWIELHSFNQNYDVKSFKGEDVTRVRVLGKVKRIIKEL